MFDYLDGTIPALVSSSLRETIGFCESYLVACFIFDLCYDIGVWTAIFDGLLMFRDASACGTFGLFCVYLPTLTKDTTRSTRQ